MTAKSDRAQPIGGCQSFVSGQLIGVNHAGAARTPHAGERCRSSCPVVVPRARAVWWESKSGPARSRPRSVDESERDHGGEPAEGKMRPGRT